MITGTKFWNDKDTYHVQDNNVFEESYRKKYGKGFLEDCGPTSAINAITSMLGPTYFDQYKIGGYTPQPEDLLSLYFNDPRNYTALKEVRKDVNPASMMNNQVPQYYPIAVKTLFGIDCDFKWEGIWEKVIEYLKVGQAVQLCEPGHYTCGVAYDDEKEEVIYNDPWSGHYADGGFNRRYTKEYFKKSIARFIIVFKGLFPTS